MLKTTLEHKAAARPIGLIFRPMQQQLLASPPDMLARAIKQRLSYVGAEVATWLETRRQQRRQQSQPTDWLSNVSCCLLPSAFWQLLGTCRCLKAPFTYANLP